jgi:hypothetical protein
LQELRATLKERLFSVTVDETTDRSTAKQLSIIVQYWDKNEIKSSFIDLIEAHNCSANKLYNLFRQAFLEKKVPLDNITGFCSDTTNVMMGTRHSFATLLKAELPHVVIVKCSCHMIHLCASNACLQLPKSIEDLCRNVYNHFNRGSKRQDLYKDFQSFVDVKPHKILAPGQTKWFSSYWSY